MMFAAARTASNESFVVGRAPARVGQDPWLRTGAQYRDSLRDGRLVIIEGRDVADVTEEPALSRGIDNIAGYMDGQFAFWKIATPLSYRAEIFVGTAQMIVNALGTDHIPAVRAMVADVIAYAVQLRGMLIAAVENAQPAECGVMLPNHSLVTAGRLLSIED